METRVEPVHKYPKGAYFILAGYLLERMVYYGLFGGAVFYMQRVLHFSAAESSTIKAVLEGLIYLAPVFGAVIADSFFGKFRLVFTMCCGYVLGTIVFSLSSATPLMTSVELTKATGIGGLLMFGMCGGLMKAVYSSLGPDQFILPQQRELQQRFFYFFYWMINAGAFLGQLLTAQLRGSVQCFGGDCFMLPFLILVAMMVISTTIFASGKRFYREAPPDPMVVRAFRCVCRAIKLRFRKDAKPIDHWLDRAALPGEGAVNDPQLISDVKRASQVFILMTTYPVFWALFFQTSTGMIFQAKRLEDHIGTYRIPPELTSAINPLLILILIPIFDLVIYPTLKKCNLFTKSTTRMTAGMLFAVASFVIYGCLNLQLEQEILGPNEASVQVYNNRPCPLTIRPWEDMNTTWVIPPGGQMHESINLDRYKSSEEAFSPMVSEECGENRSQWQVVSARLKKEHRTTVIVDVYSIRSLEPTTYYIKDKDAEATVRITSLANVHSTTIEEFVLNYHEMNVSILVTHGISEFKRLPPQLYKLINIKSGQVHGDVHIKQDGVYDIILSPATSMSTFAMTAPSDLHIMYTFPQYLVMTVGEVLFSVSSLDFAYTEAPNAMKSVMQAINLLTITVGLFVLSILTSVSAATGVFLHKPSREAFTFSVLMLIDAMIFFVLIRRYYIKIETAARKRDTDTIKEKHNSQRSGAVNPAYEEEKF